jgi:hypothetical protein
MAMLMSRRCGRGFVLHCCWAAFLALFIQIVNVVADCSHAKAIEPVMNLPRTIQGWTLSDEPRKVFAKNIFDYMDGAGELYIGYRFKHLDVYQYASPGEQDVLVELYWMGSPDDAFGLLSGDWGGNPVNLGQPSAPNGGASPWPGTRALYGGGLLRVWVNNLYARVMAFQETAASKAAVMAIGRLIVAGRETPAAPQLLSALPLVGDTGFKLRPDRTCYLRSHLVLNSVYFLSASNILDLGPATEAVTTSYSLSDDKGRRSARLLLIRYRDAQSAQGAIVHFEKVYLPEKHLTPATSPNQVARFWPIEDGWLGYVGQGRCVAMVFECSSRESAERFLNRALDGLSKLENTHE